MIVILIRGATASIITIFMVAYVSVQLIAVGNILNETFDWDYHTAFTIITFYTLMSGFFHGCIDKIYSKMLIIGTLVLLPVAGVIKLRWVQCYLNEI